MSFNMATCYSKSDMSSNGPTAPPTTPRGPRRAERRLAPLHRGPSRRVGSQAPRACGQPSPASVCRPLSPSQPLWLPLSLLLLPQADTLSDGNTVASDCPRVGLGAAPRLPPARRGGAHPRRRKPCTPPTTTAARTTAAPPRQRQHRPFDSRSRRVPARLGNRTTPQCSSAAAGGAPHRQRRGPPRLRRFRPAGPLRQRATAVAACPTAPPTTPTAAATRPTAFSETCDGSYQVSHNTFGSCGGNYNGTCGAAISYTPRSL